MAAGLCLALAVVVMDLYGAALAGAAQAGAPGGRNSAANQSWRFVVSGDSRN